MFGKKKAYDVFQLTDNLTKNITGSAELRRRVASLCERLEELKLSGGGGKWDVLLKRISSDFDNYMRKTLTEEELLEKAEKAVMEYGTSLPASVQLTEEDKVLNELISKLVDRDSTFEKNLLKFDSEVDALVTALKGLRAAVGEVQDKRGKRTPVLDKADLETLKMLYRCRNAVKAKIAIEELSRELRQAGKSVPAMLGKIPIPKPIPEIPTDNKDIRAAIEKLKSVIEQQQAVEESNDAEIDRLGEEIQRQEDRMDYYADQNDQEGFVTASRAQEGLLAEQSRYVDARDRANRIIQAIQLCLADIKQICSSRDKAIIDKLAKNLSSVDVASPSALKHLQGVVKDLAKQCADVTPDTTPVSSRPSATDEEIAKFKARQSKRAATMVPLTSAVPDFTEAPTTPDTADGTETPKG